MLAQLLPLFADKEFLASTPYLGVIKARVGDQDILTIAEMVRAYVPARNGEPFHPTLSERLFGGGSRRAAWELGR